MFYWALFVGAYLVVAMLSYRETHKQVVVVAAAIKQHHGHDMGRRPMLYTALCSAVWPVLLVRTLVGALLWRLRKGDRV